MQGDAAHVIVLAWQYRDSLSPFLSYVDLVLVVHEIVGLLFRFHG